MSQTLSQSLAVTVSPATTVESNSTAIVTTPLSQNILNQTLSPQQNQMTSEVNSQSQLSSQSSINSSNNLSQNSVKNPVVILDKNRLQELVQEVDPNEQLEEEVEEMLLSIADDFIESLVSTSAMFAKHRKSSTLDVKDVQLALEKNWKIWIPGFGSDEQHRHHKKSFSTEAHKQRMALIKKTLKKF